jgi:hypothetical protein
MRRAGGRRHGEDVNRRLLAFAPRGSVRQLLTPPESNLLPIDGLRALLWVMLMHTLWFQTLLIAPGSAVSFLDRAPGWIVVGHYGVDVVFVISGFLIGLIWPTRENAGRTRCHRKVDWGELEGR